MKLVIGYIPETKNAFLYRDRLWNWGRFLDFNRFRDDYKILLIIPAAYRADDFMSAFNHNEVVFYDNWNESKVFLSDFIEKYKQENFVEDKNVVFILSAEEKYLESRFSRSHFLRFEMGVF